MYQDLLMLRAPCLSLKPIASYEVRGQVYSVLISSVAEPQRSGTGPMKEKLSSSGFNLSPLAYTL
jgi:hypothetical protein